MKILLVDDDISSVNALANLLRHDHSLKITTNGLDALQEANGQGFDLIITDIKMPRMNGIELLKALREGGRSTPVIVVTGFPENDHLAAAKRYQAAIFTKPINVELFMDELKRVEMTARTV